VVKGLPDVWGACYRTISFKDMPLALAHWKDITAVGLEDHKIVILNTITGVQVAVLSGHTNWVRSLAFIDGTSLVSGSDDKTIILWDIQTGGVVEVFHGHTGRILSVSISADRTRIASGSWDQTIRLWDIGTGECHHVIGQQEEVECVTFSPTKPHHLISVSGGVVQQWDVNGHQIEPTYQGSHAVFSWDGTHFILCGRNVAAIQNTDSGVVVARCAVPNNSNANPNFVCPCFSPNGKLVAVAAWNIVYVWDITGTEPLLIETFTGHTNSITSLMFSSPSTLISASKDRSVKFWEVTASLTDQNTALTSMPIKSINLQAKHGIAILSDSAGTVKTWDLSTGICKRSFKTPAKGKADIQEIDGRLIAIWYDWKIGEPGKVHVWDVEEGELLRVFCECWSRVLDLRISEDGSKVFLLDHQSIQAWSISTGEAVGEVKFKQGNPWGLIVDGPRVWLSYTDPATRDFLDSNPMGWDFGIPGSPPVFLSNTFPSTPRFNFLNGARQHQAGASWIEDTVTGKQLFYLPERFAEVHTRTNVQWDGQYLVIGHPSGEVLILDFGNVFPE
jgi:WD40 repeat protein